MNQIFSQLADKILENLRAVLRENDAKIEQAEFHINELSSMGCLWENESIKIEDAFEALAIAYKENLTPPDRKRYLQKILEKITVFYDKAANDHELKFEIRLPIMSTSRDKRWKVGMSAQKKTIAINRIDTPQVDNVITVE